MRPAYNVLLITIDSLRADMPWQGYERAIAPRLTELAKESVVYPRAYSVSSYTAKSVGALLSGRFPSTLYRGCTFFTQYAAANVFFPELLQKAGVRTMAAHAHLDFDRGKNLRQGFDVWRMTPGLKWNATTDLSITSDKMTKLAIEILSEVEDDQPFFSWFHYMDPHDQYKRHQESPDFGRKTRDYYDSEVFYTDLHVGKLLDWARTRAWWKRTVVIISSDHGEAFGDHRMYKHAFALWEVLTRVPLMIRMPDGKPQRIQQRRSHIDLAPTIMELLRVPAPSSFMGKSMVPELLGKAEPDNREPIVLDLPADTYNPPTRAIIVGNDKLIVAGPMWSFKLFDLSRDPGELNNLASTRKHRDKLEAMKRLFKTTWASIPYVKPYGGKKTTDGKLANGPRGPQ